MRLGIPAGSPRSGVTVTRRVGIIPAGRELPMAGVRPGDKVLLSGTLDDHGMAVMLARGDLGLEADRHPWIAGLRNGRIGGLLVYRTKEGEPCAWEFPDR